MSRRREPTPTEFAVRVARQREADSRALPPRHGIAFRLLICNRCRAVWPTERDPTHGGSRLDGEPCAYRWGDAVCDGTVGPLHGRRAADAWSYEPEARAAYSGSWCEVLGVPWGTTDLALVRTRYRSLSKERHPDAPRGSHAAMLALNLAYQKALAELGQPNKEP